MMKKRILCIKSVRNFVIFFLQGNFLTHSTVLKHHIPLIKDASPICAKTYRYPKIHEEEVNKQINKMLEQEIIRPSTIPWSSPLWLVSKKPNASGKVKWRVMIDYRKLNLAHSDPTSLIRDINFELLFDGDRGCSQSIQALIMKN